MAPNTKTLDAHELGHLGHEPEGNTRLLPRLVHQVKRGEPHTGPKPPACTWADTDVYLCCAHRPTARIAASMRETEIEEWKYIECICIHTHAGANGAHLHVSQWPQGWAKMLNHAWAHYSFSDSASPTQWPTPGPVGHVANLQFPM